MNMEPVFALGLGWVILDQRIEPVQILGAMVVVAAVVFLGLRKRK
jgi:drug/metabolite transporter (DMT)-like permease